MRMQKTPWCFPAAVAALSSAAIALLSKGDHVICVKSPYSWTKHLFEELLGSYGVQVSFADGRDPENFFRYRKSNTKLIVLETPNSFSYEIQDLRTLCHWAKENDIISIVDNSYSSPIYQKPIDYGADLVFHSVSKYINGHSDVVAGALCGSAQLIDLIFRKAYLGIGAICSPLEASMILRGLRTLPLRMERIYRSALRVARVLEEHPKISRVHYPFLESFPQYQLAVNQMSGCGGLLTIELGTHDIKSIENFVDALKNFLIAVSWGGHESLVFPVCALYGRPGAEDPAYPINAVRLYIGLEDPQFLLEDLDQALRHI